MSGAETPLSQFENKRDSLIREAIEIIDRHKLLKEDAAVKAMVEANFVDVEGNPVVPKVFLVARFHELKKAVSEIGQEFPDREETGGFLVEYGRSSKY